MGKCNRNPLIKYIRITLSLIIIGIGIYRGSWLGIIGVFTLISAFTGSCPFTVNINPKRDF